MRDTNKQTTKQINKRTNQETKKQKTNKQCRLFFWSDAMAGAIACGQTIQIKIQQASKQACEPTKKQRKQASDVACFFFGPMQWLEPLRAAKRYKQNITSKQSREPTQTHELSM